jgi:hypothetical protein
LVNKCSYETWLDWRKGEYYECPDEEYSEELCKFHHKQYASDEKNKKELSELLKQKVENANASRTPLKLIAYQLPRGISLSYEFKTKIYFDNADFLADADFRHSVFQSDVYFSGAKFNGGANFSHTLFNGDATFFETTFIEGTKTDFTEAKFNGEADFSVTIFNSEVVFRYTTFNGEFVFRNAAFNHTSGADFYNATFNGTVSFSDEAIVFGGLRFSDSTFNEKVEFHETTFGQSVTFHDTTFNGEVNIRHNSFDGETSFIRARFN